MSFNGKNRFIILAIILAVCVSLFSGCGAKVEQTGDNTGADVSAAASPEAQDGEANAEAPQQDGEVNAEAPQQGGDEPAQTDADTQPAPAKADTATHVSSVGELLDAIGPGAEIIVEPGKYDITAFLDELLAKPSSDDWRAEHEYIELRECFDGVEIAVKNAEGMSISGTTDFPEDTEFTVDPRYATVFTFINCDDTLIEYMKFGHTENGSCMGDVLCFDNCADIRLNTVDLFGCGVHGVSAMNGCGNISVYNSYIHNCEFGPFDFYNSRGSFIFKKCVMTGSGSGGVYQNIPGSKLRFVECSFGENETNSMYFWSEPDVSFENCSWSEITQYPDYSDGYAYNDRKYIPDFSELKVAPTDKEHLESFFWYGVEDTEEGMPILNFNYDGTAVLTNYAHDSLNLTWTLENEYLGTFEGDGISGSFTLYYDPLSESENTWLYVKIGDKSMWMF